MESKSDELAGSGASSGAAVDGAGVPSLPAWLLSTAAPLDIASFAPAESALRAEALTAAGAAAAAAASASLLQPAAGDVPSSVALADTDNDDESALPVAGRCDTDERACALRAGFRLRDFTIRDTASAEVLWQARDDEGVGASSESDAAAAAGAGAGAAGAVGGSLPLFSQEVEAHLPARTLTIPAVTRSLTFSSREVMRDFFLVQRLWIGDAVVEVQEFTFGFVIPGSTNTWETIVESATHASGDEGAGDGSATASTSVAPDSADGAAAGLASVSLVAVPAGGGGSAAAAATVALSAATVSLEAAPAAPSDAASANEEGGGVGDESAPMDAASLSGNVLVETRFYDKSTLITTAVVRLFYDR